MMSHRIGILLAVCGLGAVPAAAQHQHDATSPPTIVSQAQTSDYALGLYWLHNFEYDRAAAAFGEAQAADPGNVMAYWGEAMTYNHPLWAFQDPAKARAVLARLGPTREARLAKARNPREAAWLDAVETLYGEGDKVERDRLYHQTMMALFVSDPADVDARTFAALATLGLASEGRDTGTYMKAAAMLEEAFEQNPDHPGLLHYMIHSYDDAAHAPLGLRAARRYASVAPDAGHAQHMVSHIYLALGDWEAVERTNIQAMKVVNAQRAAAGRPPSFCGHYNEWLAYALDQQGKDSRALVQACQAEAVAEVAGAADQSVLGQMRSSFNNWATIAVRTGVDTGRWPDATVASAGARYLLGRFELYYGALLAARHDAPAAERALVALKRDRVMIAQAMPRERPDDHESGAWLDRAVAQGEAIVALAKGERERGLALLSACADAEAKLPPSFGPPVLAKPSAELLGDELLAQGHKAAAAAAYARALAAAPGRRLSQEGLKMATAS